MAKKKIKLNIAFDAPVTLTLSVICILLFVLNTFAFKGTLTEKLLASPTTVTGERGFIPTAPLSYFRLIFYVFGAVSFSTLITQLIFVLLLGPSMEERYGSVVIGIMIGVSTLFSGVLNACFCNRSLVGALPVVFMLIFLNSFISFSKKKVPLSFLAVFVLFIVREISEKNPNGIVGIIICIAGGLCGSLFAFLTSPKARAEKKGTKGTETGTRGTDLTENEKKAYLEELDSQSPRNKKNNRRNDDDDETTVIGTLKF